MNPRIALVLSGLIGCAVAVVCCRWIRLRPIASGTALTIEVHGIEHGDKLSCSAVPCGVEDRRRRRAHVADLDATGRATLRGLAAGRYTLWLRATDPARQQRRISLGEHTVRAPAPPRTYHLHELSEEQAARLRGR